MKPVVLYRPKSVRTKLLAAFAAVTVLLVAVGVFDLSEASGMKAKGEVIYADNLVSVQELGQVQSTFLTARLNAIAALMAQDATSTQGYLDALDANYKTIERAWKAYSSTASKVAGKAKDVAKFNDAFARYQVAIRDRFLPLVKAHDIPGYMKIREAVFTATVAEASTALESLGAKEKASGQAASAALSSAASRVKAMTAALIAAGAAIALGLGLFVARGVSKPLKNSVRSLAALAQKDLTHRLVVDTADETATMANSFNEAVDQLRAALETIDGNAGNLAAAAEELSAVTAQIGSNSEEASAQSTMVAGASEEVTQNVATVAAAVEEMTSSIVEISKSTSEAAVVAGEAVEIAANANESITKLGASSVEIGNVVRLITTIAEQTNLLALNATIEAARAGDAGRGFAVVANEVKDLANETAKATADIVERVEAIQGDTGASVKAIEKITEIIGRISDIQTGIAGAVEEQAATTAEIGRNVGEAAKGVADISENIVGVAAAAQDTAAGVGSSQQAVQDLNRMATTLTGLVREFQY